MTSVRKYSGKDWVEANFKMTLSPLGQRVADILGDLYSGIYHLETSALGKADWTHAYRIRIAVPASALATYDFDWLTRLVFLAHEYCVRVQLAQSGPGLIALVFSARQREGTISQRHPTLEEAVTSFIERHRVSLEGAQA